VPHSSGAASERAVQVEAGVQERRAAHDWRIPILAASRTASAAGVTPAQATAAAAPSESAKVRSEAPSEGCG